MKTIIMAGGKGTRIAELFPSIPKPLIPIESEAGEALPVLEWEIMSLVKQGFEEIVLTVGYRSDQIIDYFGDGSKWGAKIDYFVEDTPLGNAGALFKMKLDDDFLLLNADAVFDVDFNRMVEYHKTKGALATLFTHPNSHPYDSGLIIAGMDGSVDAWLTKEDSRPPYYKNRVNAGLHVLSPKALEQVAKSIDVEKIGSSVKVDLDRQILKPLCGTHTMFCYDSPEYVKDMGTPERFASVSNDFRNGTVAAKNLKNSQKAIFLDRDGTINKYVGFLRNIQSIEQGQAIKTLKQTMTDINSMKIDEQKRALRSGYDMDILPADLMTYGDEAKKQLGDLQTRNERMFYITILFMHTAENLQKLENIMLPTLGLATQNNCPLIRLENMQEEGLMSSLILGRNLVPVRRTMTTTGTAIFVPFTTQELFMEGESLYYGLNAVSNNMILVDRKQLKKLIAESEALATKISAFVALAEDFRNEVTQHVSRNS